MYKVRLHQHRRHASWHHDCHCHPYVISIIKYAKQWTRNHIHYNTHHQAESMTLETMRGDRSANHSSFFPEQGNIWHDCNGHHDLASDIMILHWKNMTISQRNGHVCQRSWPHLNMGHASSFDMFPYYNLILNITTIEGTKRPEHK